MNDDCIFCKIKSTQDLTFVKEYDNWVLRLNLKQFLPGTCILVHKTHKQGLFSLNQNELFEAMNILRSVEKGIKGVFSPDLMNYMQTNNRVKHLHFHIIPRYKNPKKCYNVDFIDEDYGEMPVEKEILLDESVMRKMAEDLKNEIEKNE